jgi:hypothetical protein
MMSPQVKTAIIVVVALVALGGFNYLIRMDPTQLAARGVGKDPHAHGDEHEPQEQEQQQRQQDPTKPMGPKHAPVLIQACYVEECIVHDELRPILKDVAQDYAGLVRVEFLKATEPENREIIDQAAERLADGLIINGEVTKETPGTPFGMSSFRGLASLEEWSTHDLRLAIEHELKQKGVEFTSHVGEEAPPITPPPPPLPGHPEPH